MKYWFLMPLLRVKLKYGCLFFFSGHLLLLCSRDSGNELCGKWFRLLFFSLFHSFYKYWLAVASAMIASCFFCLFCFVWNNILFLNILLKYIIDYCCVSIVFVVFCFVLLSWYVVTHCWTFFFYGTRLFAIVLFCFVWLVIIFKNSFCGLVVVLTVVLSSLRNSIQFPSFLIFYFLLLFISEIYLLFAVLSLYSFALNSQSEEWLQPEN